MDHPGSGRRRSGSNRRLKTPVDGQTVRTSTGTSLGSPSRRDHGWSFPFHVPCRPPEVPVPDGTTVPLTFVWSMGR